MKQLQKIRKPLTVFALMLLVWFSADYIPQLFSAADTLVNIAGLAALFIAIYLIKFLIQSLTKPTKTT